MGPYLERDDACDEPPPGPGAPDGFAPVRPGRRRRGPILASILFGLVVSASVLWASGAIRPGSPFTAGDRLWPLSGLLLALVAGLWLAGAVEVVRMLIGRTRLPVTRRAALLAAFGMGPLLVALFFFPIAVAQGFDSPPKAATAAAAALAALGVLIVGRRWFLRFPEELLLSLFLWMLLLVAPALWGDETARQAAGYVVAALRRVGLLP